MGSRAAVETYLNSLRDIAGAPSTTEFSYRPALKTLIEALALCLNRPLARLTLEPGHITDAGAPDAVLYGPTSEELIGYIESKNLGKDLDNLTGRDLVQFDKYRKGMPILVYTNYLDFRLYENAQMTGEVTLCREQQITGAGSLRRIVERKATDVACFFDRFLQLSTPAVADAGTLARLLAHKAHLLEGVLLNLLNREQPSAQLQGQLEAYRQWLIPDLTPEQFADYYAQTLTYGMFFAAFENGQRSPPLPFTRANLLTLLPAAVKPVRAIFQLLAGQFLPEELDWIVDDLMRLLEKADLGAIAYQLGRSRDPTVHFYETFFGVYDPAEREMRGVYYTPDEVVSYIVRSVDKLLRVHFGKEDGLASPDVTLLDPALGTGTFVTHALRQVAENFGPAYAGDVRDHLREHTLRKWYGFELLAAPYVLAYLKLGQTLEQLGVTDVAPQIYLTNTLSEHEFPPTLPGPFEQAISEDGQAAARVKGEERILVVLGNPPYSGTSYNVYDKVDDYKYVDREPLGERNPKWLQNDYVKFIRWAEWKIAEAEEAGYQYGVVAFVTDHSYLNNITFRGMRKHLIDHFTRIYVLNLHGNSRMREVPPAGVPRDDNVFDIKQGVAIGIFVREAGQEGAAEVFYADLWGDRQWKYDYLEAHDVTLTDWTPLDPVAPYYFLLRRELPDLAEEYRRWPSIDQMARVKSIGIATGQDSLVYDYERQPLQDRFSELLAAQEVEIVPCTFRVFDSRWLCYGRAVVTRRREETMRHLFRPNLALLTFRNTSITIRQRVFVSRNVVKDKALSGQANCHVFPLYLYTDAPAASNQMALDMGEGTAWEPNLAATLLPNLAAEYGMEATAEEVFYYTCGILSAPSYQEEFESLLQVDFPHIPFTADYDVFCEMAEGGKRLVELYLLEAPDLQGLDNLTVGFPISGDNIVQRGYPRFTVQDGRVHINNRQYFEGITQQMWDYKVGSFNPLERWLKERRGRILSPDERRHYETFATAVAKVLEELPRLDGTWRLVRNGGWFNPLDSAVDTAD